jgi:peptidoglycan/LPS O-acetylase OafA/YrhL
MTEPLTYRPFGAFRFALAATVMLGHGAWIAKGYWIADTIAASRAATAAVLTFFVLSGFFLSESADRTYRGRTGAFVKNRLLKIYPAFLGALCVSLVVHSALTGAGLFEKAFSFEGVASADIWNVRNLLWNPLSVLPFFRPEDVSGKFVPAPYLFVRYVWAINVEMMFYASVAAFLLLQSKIPRISPVILAVTLLVLNIFSSTDWDAYQYIRFSPFFALGVAIYGMSRWGFGSSHTVCFLFRPCSALSTDISLSAP